MQLLPSDPDVATIVNRIKSGDIDLQPDFQRGEVWTREKKQRLIDSILRDWHVPPIHVIENPDTRKQEVLDGQQRLAAIRDFVDGVFPVAGSTEPFDPEIFALDDRFYTTLPDEWRRRFNQFTIRIFRIVDYEGREPAELFFRLNQPASLTGAEQRNAFFGKVREQIKSLVAKLTSYQLNRFLAFSNSRMAYDDVLARTALAVERRSLAEKITSENLAAFYRTDRPVSEDTIRLIEKAITTLANGVHNGNELVPKFNKATLFSWLIFLVRAALVSDSLVSSDRLTYFLSFFEEMRISSGHDPELSRRLLAGPASAARLFSMYEIRSSARVADVSSVLLRDAVIWLVFEEFCNSSVPTRTPPRLTSLKKVHAAFQVDHRTLEEDLVARRLIERGWGKLE